MIKSVSKEQLRKIRHRLMVLYGGEAERLLERIFMMIGRYGVGGIEAPEGDVPWDERDSVLITYADSIQDPSVESPLRALNQFTGENLKGAIRTIHLLPFYPWSSDDGFSVIDYRAVDPGCGTWADVEHLGHDFDLMFDMVMNHCSSSSSWFKDFVAGIEPARFYFLSMDPKGDYSAVVRPRTSPLLTKTRTRDGDAHIWTTFSADQVDLNWQNPEVFIEFLDILMFYISKGMRIARMDAVAFLWKEIGTSCIHLPETHEIVKLFRDLVEVIAPRTLLLTETNVPHEENISYFGRGDEAQMVYQFSLPPLLLHGLATGKASWLTKWAINLAPPPEGCTFFNFTASHDGIGMRPVEDLLPEKEKKRLIRHVEKSGGKINYRSLPDGSRQPYELNVTYYSALGDSKDPMLGARRFLCSQALMLSLRGIPGIYLHSLTATPNDLKAVKETGINRRINRRKWEIKELEAHLDDPVVNFVFGTYARILRRRSDHPAFHPDAGQRVYDVDPELFVHDRTSRDGEERILCCYNFTSGEKRIHNGELSGLLQGGKKAYDILSGKTLSLARKDLVLEPYQARWLVIRD